MPDSCSSCGELTEPPLTITSRPASAVRVPAPVAYSTPVARRPSKRMRVASAPVSTRTFGRAIAGRRKARAADMRRPSLGGDLIDADAVLGGAVEVGVEGQPGLAAGLQIAAGERVDGRRAIGHVERPAGAAPAIGARLVVLDRLEDRQQIVIAPARVAGVAPLVEVGGVAAHPDHGVDGGGAAEQLAARPVVGIAGEPRVGFGLVVPVDGRVEEGLAIAERHLDEEAAVGAARLQHQHRVAAVRRQALGDDAAGRAGADDDEVEALHQIGRARLPATGAPS